MIRISDKTRNDFVRAVNKMYVRSLKMNRVVARRISCVAINQAKSLSAEHTMSLAVRTLCCNQEVVVRGYQVIQLESQCLALCISRTDINMS